MFTLQAKPTFPAPVDIPRPGEPPAQINFVFRHKTRDEADALINAMQAGEKSLDELVREVVVEWQVPDLEFSDAALGVCFQTFPGSALAIWTGYRRALVEGGRKN